MDKTGPRRATSYKIYFVTSPFELPNSGDTDYVVGMISILGPVQAQHLQYQTQAKTKDRESYDQLRQKLKNPQSIITAELEDFRKKLYSFLLLLF